MNSGSPASGHPDPRPQRPGIIQLGEATAGNLVRFEGNGRISDSGIPVDGTGGTDATDYTLSDSDNGGLTAFTSGSAVTVTVPAGLNAPFQWGWQQAGAGTITFQDDGTSSLNNRQSQTDSAGQWAQGAICSVPGEADTFILLGDTA